MQENSRGLNENARWFVALSALAAIATLIGTLAALGIIRLPTPDPTGDLYTSIHNGKPSVSDDLTQANRTWMPINLHGDCTFSEGQLHVTQPHRDDIEQCIATDLHVTNYAIEVSEDIDAGFSGGVALRVGQADYRFNVTNEGTWDFASDSGPPASLTPTLGSGTINNGAHIGPHETQSIFIVVQGNQFDFWVNGTHLARIVDNSPPSGIGDGIGLFAFSQSDPCDIAFSSLKIWQR